MLVRPATLRRRRRCPYWVLGSSTEFVAALERSRLLRSDQTREQAIATVWLVTSAETFFQLTDGYGLTLDEFQLWVEKTLQGTVVG